MATQDNQGNRMIMLAVLPMVIPLVLAIGVFFTAQNDIRHLEDRVANDESSMVRDFTDLEGRLRVVELESASRLSNIEARLIVLENQTSEILMLLQQERRSEIHPSYQSNPPTGQRFP